MGTKYKSGDKFVLKIEKVVTTDNTTLYKTNCNDYLLLPGDLDELPKIIDGFEETWIVVEQAAHYSFNASHSLRIKPITMNM